MRSWVEHTGELELALEAGSPEGVFEEALTALGELLAEHQSGGGSPREGDEVRVEVSASAPDRTTLLAEWLSELAFHAESRGLVPLRAERLWLGERELEAEVWAYRGDPPHLVKAVTYHRLGMWEEAGSWRARVVLDV